MRKYRVVYLIIILCLSTFSCNKEKVTPLLPYIGAWQTSTFAIPIDDQGSLVNRKMVCTIESDSFMSTIKGMLGHIEEPLCEVKGIITHPENNILHFELVRLGCYWGNRIEWSDSASTEFDTLYTEFVHPFLQPVFDAEYIISGNELDLITTDPPDTIHLTRL